MDGDSTLKDSRIDMRDIVEQEGISFLEQNEGSSKDIPEISVEEQRGNQDEEDSTHMKVFITDRDRRGINEYLKVIFLVVTALARITCRDNLRKMFLYDLIYLCEGQLSNRNVTNTNVSFENNVL